MSEIVDIEIKDKTLKLTFKAGELTERFVRNELNLPALIDAFSTGAASITLDLKYKSNLKAKETANSVKNKLAEFLKSVGC